MFLKTVLPHFKEIPEIYFTNGLINIRVPLSQYLNNPYQGNRHLSKKISCAYLVNYNIREGTKKDPQADGGVLFTFICFNNLKEEGKFIGMVDASIICKTN